MERFLELLTRIAQAGYTLGHEAPFNSLVEQMCEKGSVMVTEEDGMYAVYWTVRPTVVGKGASPLEAAMVAICNWLDHDMRLHQ